MNVSEIWIPLYLTAKLAFVSTVILLLVCIPVAWLFARKNFLGKPLLESIIALPIVLPPSVLGFYLLVCFAPDGPLGRLSEAMGGPSLVFSFSGLVLGSVVYSLPFVFQPLQNAFAEIRQEQLDAAATLGAGPFDRFFTLVLPNARPGLLTAAVLGFAHTVGEFGVVLMIGGSIPGETRTMSIAIYENVEALDYEQAHLFAGIMLVSSLCLLSVVYAYGRANSLFKR